MMWPADFKYPVVIVIVSWLSVMGCTRSSRAVQEAPENFKTYLDNNINRLIDWYGVPGISIALIREGELAWSSAYGYANIAQNKKMTVDAVCRTESISKSVTAWGVMKLVEEDLVDLDAPVQNYLNGLVLPESRYPWREVTIRRLLSNSAGLPLGTLAEEFAPQSGMPSLQEYLAKELRLTNEPGSAFLYSNVGYNLLELVIKEVTDRDFAEYMATEVLGPLGMQTASYGWKEEWSGTIPMGYDLQGKPVPPYVYPAKASGGLFASVEDVARFVRAGTYASGNSVLSQQSIRRMHEPQITLAGMFGFVANSYGFGHFIETLSDQKQAVWHGGQGHGWMTHFHLVPETGDGIIILTNSQRSWPLIAHILKDWSSWNNFSSVQFSRIVSASIVLWLFIGLIFLLSLWRIGMIMYDMKIGVRKFTLSRLTKSWKRIFDFLIGVFAMIILVWALTREYLFVSSIFPVGYIWLGWGLLFFSVAFLISAMTLTEELSNSQNS